MNCLSRKELLVNIFSFVLFGCSSSGSGERVRQMELRSSSLVFLFLFFTCDNWYFSHSIFLWRKTKGQIKIRFRWKHSRVEKTVAAVCFFLGFFFFSSSLLSCCWLFSYFSWGEQSQWCCCLLPLIIRHHPVDNSVDGLRGSAWLSWHLSSWFEQSSL